VNHSKYFIFTNIYLLIKTSKIGSASSNRSRDCQTHSELEESERKEKIQLRLNSTLHPSFRHFHQLLKDWNYIQFIDAKLILLDPFPMFF